MKQMKMMLAALAVGGSVWAETCVWTGSGTDCAWSDSGNWKNGKVPAAGYVDDVVFENAAPATIALGDGAWVGVKNLRVAGQDVTLTGGNLTLSEGAVEVPEGTVLTLESSFSGKNRECALVKTGTGSLLVKNYCTQFNGFDVKGGLTGIYKGGDAIQVQPAITIFDGATVRFQAQNPIENSTAIEVQAGGTLDLNKMSDVLGGIRGAGRVLGGADGNSYLTWTLENGPYPINCTFEHVVTIQFNPKDPSDEKARCVIGTSSGCAKVVFKTSNPNCAPFDVLKFKAGLERAEIKEVWFSPDSGAPVDVAEQSVVDLAGNPVTLVGTFLETGETGTSLTLNDVQMEGGRVRVFKTAAVTIQGGTSSNTSYIVRDEGGSLVYAGGRADQPVFQKSKAGTSLVLADGETRDATWYVLPYDVNGAQAPEYIVVSGGVHSVNNTVDTRYRKCIRQTGGSLELKKGIICHQGNFDNKSVDMPLEISGGQLVYRSPQGTGYANQGTGIDASGDAEVWFYDEGGNQRIRVGSDSESHTFRIRDNATVNIMNSLILMVNGNDGVAATGTVDLVGGTLAMRSPFDSPGSQDLYPTFLLFNGGLLSYPEITGTIINRAGRTHSILVGEQPARIFVNRADSASETSVQFESPFKANPANTTTDGGLVKDGLGTLYLSTPADLAGPVTVKAGKLQTSGSDGVRPMLGTGSITLQDAALYPENKSGKILYATGEGSRLDYRGASFLYLPVTTQGGTYEFGSPEATSSAMAPVDAASLLVIRNGSPNEGIGTAFKVKVNGGVEQVNGLVTQPIFSSMSDSANDIGLFSFLSYDAEKGLVPAAMTPLASAAATDLADVTADQSLDADKQVHALRLHKANLALGAGVTLTVGDSSHPAEVLFNNALSANPVALTGAGTLAFGSARGFLVNSYRDSNNDVSVKISGANGVVFGSSPEYPSRFLVRGANDYAGGTWISGTRVTPCTATAFGSGRTVRVTGNSAWGGQLSFDSNAVTTFDYDLQLAGVGVLWGSQREGAVRADRSTTLAGSVELTDNTRFGVYGKDVALTLAGALSGAGTLEVVGAGTVRLAQANPGFTGGVDLTEGRLVATTAEALGTGPVKIGAASVLRIEADSDQTVTNRISGIGLIELAGAGRVQFTNLDGFKGDLVLENGVLNVDGELAVTSISGTGAISGTGTLYVDIPEGAVSGCTAEIRGDVSVVKRGGGAFALVTPATYTGSTTIEGGSLVLGVGGSFDAILKGAVLHLDASDASTVTTDADGNVSEWRDADGREIAFTNADVETQPVRRTAQIYGRDTLFFSRGLAHLTSTVPVANKTIFIVHRNKSGARPAGMSSGWGCAGIYGYDRQDRGIRFNEVDYWNWDGWNGYLASIVCNGTAYAGTTRPTARFIADDATVSDIELPGLRDGALVAVGDYWQDPGYKRSYYGDIGEIIVFDRTLTDFERKAVRKHLFRKWGIADPDGAENLEELLTHSLVHLDATVPESLTLDATGHVSAWRDAHGRAQVFSNALPAESPVYVAEAMNGKAALRFDDVYMHLASAKEVPSRTVVIVHRNKSGTRPESMNGYWGCAGIYGWMGRDDGIRFNNEVEFDTANWGGKTFVINGVSTARVKLDEVSVSLATLSSVKTGDRMAVGDYWHDMQNGVRVHNYRRSYYGDIGEVLVFTRELTERERKWLMDYLMEKWGLEVAEEPTLSGADNILPATTDLTVSAGATLDLAGYNQTLTALNGSGAVVSSDKPVTLTLTGANRRFSGTIDEDVALMLESTATFTLGANGAGVANIAGSGRVAGGPLTVIGRICPGGSGTIGTLTFASAPVVVGATLEIELDGEAGDQMVVESAFDVSPLSLEIPSFTRISGIRYEIIRTAGRSGTLLGDNFSGSSKTWVETYDATSVWLKKNSGTILIFR